MVSFLLLQKISMASDNKIAQLEAQLQTWVNKARQEAKAKGAEEWYITEEKAAEARRVEEQWRKVEAIAVEGHWLVEERVVAAVAV